MDRRTKTDRNEEVVKLKNAGYSYAAIARKMNISAGRVRDIYERDTNTRQYYSKFPEWFKCFEQASCEIVGNTSVGGKVFLILARNDILSKAENDEIVKDSELLSLGNFGKKSLHIARRAFTLHRLKMEYEKSKLEKEKREKSNCGYSPDKIERSAI